MMELTSHDLLEVMKTLTVDEQRLVELCVKKGLSSEEAREAIRKFKARLKRKARAGKHGERAVMRKDRRSQRDS